MHLPLGRHRGSRAAGLAPVVITLMLLALVIVAFLLLPPATAGAQGFAAPDAQSMLLSVETAQPPGA